MRLRTTVAALSTGALLALAASDSFASSHREAPFIARNPKVDGTDLYAFRSYESGRDDYVTIIANYQPLQDTYGGPNFFAMDPTALYEIEVDNTGDGVEDITFQFRFDNSLNDSGDGNTGVTLGLAPDGGPVSIPFVAANITLPIASGAGNVVPITNSNAASVLNLVENYSVKVVRGGRRTGTASDVTKTGDATFKKFTKPLDYVGPATFGGSNWITADGGAGSAKAAYGTYANSYIYNIDVPGCTPTTGNAKMFVGQRAEGFAVNLGVIFDLVAGGSAAVAGVVTGSGGASDGTFTGPTAYKNVTTIALEIPRGCLAKTPGDFTANGTLGSGETTIGVWTTASLRQARLLNPNAKFRNPTKEGGPWVQVSRLGMPLVNEVVIGLKDKDRFNGSNPKDDVSNFGAYVLYPTLPVALEAIFGSATLTAPATPRTDLLAVFGTGVPGVNQIGPTTDAGVTLTPSEMLRLNVANGFVPKAPNDQLSLGAALCFPRDADAGGTTTVNPGADGCDPTGFPNGRRPGDDITDIALRVVMGYLLPSSAAPSGGLPLTDAVPNNAKQFDATFPYLRAPIGYNEVPAGAPPVGPAGQR